MRGIFIFLLLCGISAVAQEVADKQPQQQTEQKSDEAAATQEDTIDQDTEDEQTDPQEPEESATPDDEQATDQAPRKPIHIRHRSCNNPKAANMTQEELDALSEGEFQKLCGASNAQAGGTAGIVGQDVTGNGQDDLQLAQDAAALAEATEQGTALADIKQATGMDDANNSTNPQGGTSTGQTPDQQFDMSLDNVSNQMGDVSTRLRAAKARAAQNTASNASGIKRNMSGWGSSSSGEAWPTANTTGYHNGDKVKRVSSGPSTTKINSSSSSSSGWKPSRSSSGSPASSSGSNMSSGSRSSGGSRASSGSANMGGNKTSSGSSSGSKSSGGSSSGGSKASSSSASASSANMEGGSSKSQAKPQQQKPQQGSQGSAGSGSGGLELYGNSNLTYDETYLFPMGNSAPQSRLGELKDPSAERALKQIFELNDDGRAPTIVPY